MYLIFVCWPCVSCSGWAPSKSKTPPPLPLFLLLSPLGFSMWTTVPVGINNFIFFFAAWILYMSSYWPVSQTRNLEQHSIEGGKDIIAFGILGGKAESLLLLSMRTSSKETARWALACISLCFLRMHCAQLPHTLHFKGLHPWTTVQTDTFFHALLLSFCCCITDQEK